jgi:hypothetical protein
MPGGFGLLLPNTASTHLRIVIVILAAVLCALAANWVLFSAAGWFAGEPVVGPLAMAAGAAYLAAQLWQLKARARKAAKFIIVFLMLVGILGVFNPFMAMDHAAEHGGAEPDWMLLAAIAAPLVALGLYCYWALDRFKDEFG